jgi:conjugal transfer/entry exclusion protein
MRKQLFLSCAALCLWVATTSAQLVVHDPVNFGANSVTAGQTTWTAIQSTITAVEAVTQTADMVLELTPVDGLIAADGISEDMATLADLVSQATGLGNDISSLNAQITVLFDIDHPPDTTALLRTRLIQIRQARYQGYVYALRVQTLITTALRTVDHATQLMYALGEIIGNKSAHQRMGEQQGTLSKTLTTMQVTTTAYERAGSVDKMEELLTLASLRAINARVWEREQ